MFPREPAGILARVQWEQRGSEPRRPYSKAGGTRLCSQVLLCFRMGSGGGGGQVGTSRSCPFLWLLCHPGTDLLPARSLGQLAVPHTYPAISPEWISGLQGLNEVLVIPDVAVWVHLHFGCIWPSHHMGACVCVCVHVHPSMWEWNANINVA